MTVYLGSAHIDERGKATGGKAGDQNGREVSTQKWYKHEKGWVVLRPKSREAGRKIAWDMQAACDNPHIGYDQSQRNTLYAEAKPYGFDCSKVKVDCETDCSSLVRVCCCYAGIMVGAFSTANEASVLTKTGAFVKLTDAKYTTKPDYLRAGDVLVTATQGHTVVVLNDGELAGDDEPDIPAPANPVNPDGAIYMYTKGDYYLRSRPDKNSESYGVVKSHSYVRVFDRSPENPKWFGIKVIETEKHLTRDKGYISEKALPGME